MCSLFRFQFNHGVKKILVSAPVKSEGILNIVVGCNDKLYDPAKNHIVTAASCTTNCLAPVVKVIKENLVRFPSPERLYNFT